MAKIEELENFDELQISDDLEYRSLKPLEFGVELKPFIKSEETMRFLDIPSIEPIQVKVSHWDKIRFIFIQYGNYIDILIKLTPVIIPIIKIINWFINLKKGKQK